ncbi:branched-chain amino acid transport system II carrier protein, partial [uncultured Granulicatella sp.]|uniref:branched-chain amino acid transport system II carrier protein n=1 Tax=uncultured Granulicatella sp. TaxID=316089 RepID=UPI00260E58AB
MMDVITAGFALFAMLFGAGNLIFPPMLGYELGNSWGIASFAFILTGVGIPLMGIIASANAGKSLDSFSDKVSPLFAKFYGIALILSIGPLLALPRTGATAYEVTFYHAGFTTSIWKYVYLGIYFLLALLFSLKSSKVVDRVGKILTPILLIVLFIILVKGVFFNDLPIVEKIYELPFKKGFTEGYQTMDALATIVFSTVILNAIRGKTELTPKQEFSYLLKVGLIAAAGLAIVYAGLSYIGASFGGMELVAGAEKTDLLVKISINLLGKIGYLILAICVAGACLTTSIGLIVTVAEYFSGLIKISYEKLVVITTIIGFVFAMFGVNKIVIISVPVLVFLYPISIALIILNFFRIKNANIFKGVVLVAGIIGLY